MKPQVKPLLKFHNYFIHSDGYVFKTELNKEEIVKARQTTKSKEVFIAIEGKQYNLLNLMIQHFIGDLNADDRVRFKISPGLKINLSSIIIKKSIGSSLLTPENEATLYNFKCDQKASSANSRCVEKLTAVEVFRTLSIHQFKCVYCGIDLIHGHWHLDHFKSIARGGKNVLENVVPSCGVCNIMKGVLEGDQFFNMCKTVANNYMFKPWIEELSERNKIVSKQKTLPT